MRTQGCVTTDAKTHVNGLALHQNHVTADAKAHVNGLACQGHVATPAKAHVNGCLNPRANCKTSRRLLQQPVSACAKSTDRDWRPALRVLTRTCGLVYRSDNSEMYVLSLRDPESTVSASRLRYSCVCVCAWRVIRSSTLRSGLFSRICRIVQNLDRPASCPAHASITSVASYSYL